MLRTQRAGKGGGWVGGLWEGGLSLSRTEGAQACLLPLVSEGGGAPSGSPAGFLGSSGWCKCPPLLYCSSSLEVPSHLPLLISPPSFLCRQDPCGLEGALEGVGPAWELSRFPVPEWVGQTSSAHFLILWSWRTPLDCLSCSLLASLLCPQDQPGPEGTTEGVGPSPRAGQTSLADWAGKMLGPLLL